MKKLFCLCVAVFMATQIGYAEKTHGTGIGPYLFLKGGVNAASIPTGEKTGFAFNGIPDFGVAGYMPFSREDNIGLEGELGYTTYAFDQKIVIGSSESDPYTFRYNYITIAPNINFTSFLLGLSLGIPVGSSVSFNGNSTSGTTDNMATIVEVRIGAMFPLLTNDSGRLNFHIMGGYMLTGIASNVSSGDSKYNPKVASVSAGVSYLFNVGK